MLIVDAARHVFAEIGGSGSGHAMPKRGAAIRLLRQWLLFVFATAAMQAVDFSGPINSTVLLQKQLWAQSTALYERINHISRPSVADATSIARMKLPQHDDVFSLRFNGTFADCGRLWFGRWADEREWWHAFRRADRGAFCERWERNVVEEKKAQQSLVPLRRVRRHICRPVEVGTPCGSELFMRGS
jgi:hypothetical protein